MLGDAKELADVPKDVYNEVARAIGKFDDETVKAFMSSSKLNEQMKNDIAEKFELASAESAAATATAASGAAATGAAGGFAAFTASVKGAVAGLATFLATNPVGWAILAAAAVAAVAGAYDLLTESFDEAAEKANDAKTEFESISSELQSLQSELATTSSRIDELKAKGPLSLAEQAELSNLERQNELLEKQIEVRERMKNVQQQFVAETSARALRKKDFTVKTGEREIDANGTKMAITEQTDIFGKVLQEQKDLDEIEARREALTNELNELLKNGDVHAPNRFGFGGGKDYNQYTAVKNALDSLDAQSHNLSNSILEDFDQINTLYEGLYDESGNISESNSDLVDSFNQVSDAVLNAGDKATKAESQIETVLSLKTMDGVKEKLINAASFGGEDTLRSAIEDTDNLTGALEHSKVSVDELVTYIMNLAGSDLGNLAEQAKQLRDAFGNRKWETLQQFDDFLKGLDGEQLHTFYKYIQDNKLDISKWSMDDLKYNFEIAVGGADESARSLEQVKEEYVGLVEGIGKVKSVLSAQGAGKTLSINDLDSVKDYADALEYVGGAYQLNRDKVTELIKAKADEEKASNSAAKALKQQEYLKNAAEIEQLRQRIIDNNLGEYESVDAIQAVIDARLDENSTLEDSIAQYDVMNTALDQATGAYQRWLDAQSDTQPGSMFDQSLQAIDRIKNTIVNSDSADYGHIGDTRYQAALEFIIPDSIDADDEDAVKKYLSSLDKYMFTDDDGKFAGLDIEAYCQKAVERGLMVLEDGEFRVAGQTTMQEFAEGMGDSLDFTRSAIDYMKLFGGQFSWADEEAQTLGDIGVAAAKAVEELRQIDGLGNVPIQIDVSEVENADEAVSVLDDTIASMNDVKAKFGVDSSEAEHANTVIRYCVEQKQQLTAPAIMDVDTSKVQGKLGEATDLLQQFKTAQNNLDTQKALGLDTKEAQAEVDSLASKIKNNDVMMKIGVDTSSAESISGWIESHNSYEAICKLGVDESAIIGYQPQDKTATTHYDVDKAKVDAYQKQNVDKTAKVTYTPIHTAVDLYNPKNLERKVTYTITTRRTSGKNSTDTGTEGTHGVNGTAHVSGTAHAGGTWGAKQGGKTLLGELGRRYCDRTRQRV